MGKLMKSDPKLGHAYPRFVFEKSQTLPNFRKAMFEQDIYVVEIGIYKVEIGFYVAEIGFLALHHREICA